MGLKPETVERVLEMWAHSGEWIKNPALYVFEGEVTMTVPPALRGLLDGVEPTEEAVCARLSRDFAPEAFYTTLAYADEATLRPATSSDIVRIADDDPRVARMGTRANPAEWREAAGGEPAAARFARLDGDAIAAMSAYEIRGDTVGQISVFTAAEYRGRGWSACVATASANEILSRGFVPQWQAQVKNTASARVADKLGFEPLITRTMIRVYE